MLSAILRTSALPVSGPFPTPDPFLFCVYHVDDYPADESGGRMEAPSHGDGADFDPSAPYRMYHGDRVPGRGTTRKKTPSSRSDSRRGPYCSRRSSTLSAASSSGADNSAK